MKPEVLVLIWHGVENTASVYGYANILIEGIQKNLPGSDVDRFSFIALDWNKDVQPRELRVFDACEKGLPFEKARKIKMTMAADVVCSARTKAGKGQLEKTFAEVDEIIFLHMAKNLGKMVKIAHIGHSQGGQNAWEFCFDTKYPASLLCVMGSPIDLKSPAFEDYGCAPNVPTILNFWNGLDIVSSRLDTVHPSPSIAAVVDDVEIKLPGWSPIVAIKKVNVKGFLGILWATARAHLYYWKSSQVHKRIAEELCKI